MAYSYYIDIAMIVIALFIVIFVLRLVSDIYISKNREKLFSENYSIAKKCKDIGNYLMAEQSHYKSCINELELNQTYECSRQIVSNANKDPNKYLIKYSNIGNDILSIEKLDFLISYLQALDDLDDYTDKLFKQVKKQLPIIIYIFSSHKRIPYVICQINNSIKKIEYSVFRFEYESPAGESNDYLEIDITKNRLKDIQSQISKNVEKSGYNKIQRNAMTNDLREAIKKRDNYTCCLCGNSVYNEPNLLLEVDHIIPIAKGGKTEASNLQTLCWRCNRQKGDN